MTTFAILQDIFREIFGDSRIVIMLQMTTGDIPDWDSFKNVEIILACEQKFDLRFRSKEIDSIKTIGDLITIIESKKAK